MQMVSLAATPVALLVPSRAMHINAGKLALISMLFTAFFLFTSAYQFPGGAIHYPNWAEAIVRGTVLPPTVAQREVGFPLLYIFGGFPWSHSFIGLTLILAAFAVLIPVLVYWSLVRASPTIAFYMGLACIISLSPFTYIKFFYPDQADMFFNLLAVALLVEFLWTGQFRRLYFFTLAALAASFTRTAGNLMFPVLLTIAFITVRGRIGHYLGCALIFVLATGAYQWHRYEIFDVRHQPSIPSGKGMQTFYGMYLFMGDFGYRLTSDIGPNTKRLLEELRQQLQPNLRQSALIQRALPDDPPEFMERHVFVYSPEELIEKISTQPNEEYWAILLGIDPNDGFYVDLSLEIARAHPWYVVQYSMRNFRHALFDPGYATSRYSVAGYSKGAPDFTPANPSVQDTVTHYGGRAEREMEYFPLKTAPVVVQKVFSAVERLWLKYFPAYVRITSALLVIAWIGAFFCALCWVIPRTRLCQTIVSAGANRLIAPVVAASALLIYQDLATAMFSQPNHRYFHMTEPLRLVIAGFGLVFLMSVLPSVRRTRSAAIGGSPTIKRKHQSFVSAIQKYDLLYGYFGQRRTQWIFWLVIANAGLFAWWTSSMIIHTSGPVPPA